MPRTLLLALLVACADDPEPQAPQPGDTDTDTDVPAVTSRPTTPDGAVDLALLQHLVGLWSGPASQTPLGTFPLMNVDMRLMGDRMVWGRVDLDTDNALRFGFAVERRGPDALVYRNGGYFLGLLRDDRTALVEADPEAARWRYCHVERGCDYIDATYTFTGDDQLLFDVKVRGEPHVYWEATRLETRDAPPDALPSVDPDAALPDMPELAVTLAWTTPLEARADAWILLTVGDCLPSSCAVSRSTRAVVEPGATEAVLRMPEIHPGAYHMNAILDRDRNLGTTFLPSAGDGVTLPNRPVTVATSGTTEASLAIVVAP